MKAQWRKAYSKARYHTNNPRDDFHCSGQVEIILFTTALHVIETRKPKLPPLRLLFALL